MKNMKMYMEGEGVCKDTRIRTRDGRIQAEDLSPVDVCINPDTELGYFVNCFRWASIASLEVYVDSGYIVTGPDQYFQTTEGPVKGRNLLKQHHVLCTAEGNKNIRKVICVPVILDVMLIVNDFEKFEASGFYLLGSYSTPVE